MEAERKLEGATYHFRNMEELYLRKEDDFIHELEAFLVKVRSVPDVLLEDFNKEFSLGISLEEKLYPGIFKLKAQEQKKEEAIVFIEWWKNKMEEIERSKLGFLFSKRNISVHRKQVAPDLRKINLYDTITFHEDVTIEKYDEKGNLYEISRSSHIPSKSQEPKPAKIEWCFIDYPEENIMEACRKLLDKVRGFVEEAKTRFAYDQQKKDGDSHSIQD